MIFSDDEWPGGKNLAQHARHLARMFDDRRPTPGFGLNLDPSHLVWLMIDYERVVYDFADRILHVHAKDMEIDRDGLYEHGAMSAGIGWQVPRLPGLGEVRWDRFSPRCTRSATTTWSRSSTRIGRSRADVGARQARLPDRAQRAPPADRLSPPPKM